jgi:hypothetical protein
MLPRSRFLPQQLNVGNEFDMGEHRFRCRIRVLRPDCIGDLAVGREGLLRIVDERPDASLEPKAFCLRMGQAIEYELSTLSRAGITELLPERLAKYRKLGGIQPLLRQC